MIGSDVADVAHELARLAGQLGTAVRAVFHGTPMLAHPGDTGEAVLSTWRKIRERIDRS